MLSVKTISESFNQVISLLGQWKKAQGGVQVVEQIIEHAVNKSGEGSGEGKGTGEGRMGQFGWSYLGLSQVTPKPYGCVLSLRELQFMDLE